MHRAGKKEMETLPGPYEVLSGGTEDSYHLKLDGSVDRIYAYGKLGSSYPSPAEAKYIGVASQCVMQQNQYGAGHLYAMYFVRADGQVDRLTGAGPMRTITTMKPPEGVEYVAASSLDAASYLLRSDGAIDRTTGHGKIDNTMNPPPGQMYTQVSAGQFSSYFLRSDGKVDRTEGFGKTQRTIDPNAEPEKDGCSVM
jgi:hypothetical protein